MLSSVTGDVTLSSQADRCASLSRHDKTQAKLRREARGPLTSLGASQICRRRSLAENLTDIVEEHGGDILKFAGDAIIVCWSPVHGPGTEVRRVGGI